MNNKYNSKQKQGNNKSKGKSRKGGSKPKYDSREDRTTNIDINDANWYYENEALMSLFSDVAIQGINGTKLMLDDLHFIENPTIMTIYLNPAINASIDMELGHLTGINQVATKWFQMLSAQNAKTTQYQASDIMMAILAVGEVLAITSYMRRAFNMVNMYNTRNRMFPKNAISACGIDVDDFIARYPEYQQKFNTLMIAANQISFPASIPYFAKCATLFDNVYVDDATSALSQIYIALPKSTWIIDEDTESTGTVLRTEEITSGTTVRQFDEYLTVLGTMINALLNSSTLNYIYTDILNLSIKQGVQLMQFGQLIISELPVLYSEEFMLQLHNSIAMNSPLSTPEEGYTPSNDVRSNPETGLIWYNPQFRHKDTNGSTKLIDFLSPLPDTRERCNATRYTGLVTYEPEPVSGYYRTLETTLPDHYVTHYCIFTVGSQSKHSFGHPNFSSYTDTQKVSLLCRLAKFDWAPNFVVSVDPETHEVLESGDYNNYTTIDFEYLRRINDIIPLALYTLRTV